MTYTAVGDVIYYCHFAIRRFVKSNKVPCFMFAVTVHKYSC